MRTNIHVGRFINPISVAQVTKFIARITYEDYGQKYVLINKMSSRLKAQMV